MSGKPIIALVGDGVLLDYSVAYAPRWERAFGHCPAERDKDAYLPLDLWAVERLEGVRLAVLQARMDQHFWSSIPPVALALDACRRFYDAGLELVCVSALPSQFEAAPPLNLAPIAFVDELAVLPRSCACYSSR